MSLANDYAKTLQGRVGTPPFMTYDLLKGTDVLHLYRHKVESLFCIMVILIAHYKIEASVNRKQSVGAGTGREAKPPNKKWFCEQVRRSLQLQTSLPDSRHQGILICLHRSKAFAIGWGVFTYPFRKASFPSRRIRDGWLSRSYWASLDGGGSAVAKFDDDTLGGRVCYSREA